MEERKKKNYSSYKGCRLLLDKNWLEVIRVDCGIASIPLFRIDISDMVHTRRQKFIELAQ